MYVCSVSGVDGSGKSTAAGVLAAEIQRLAPEVRVATLWLRYAPRGSGGRGSTVSSQHTGHWTKKAARRIGLRAAWVAANASVYERQLSWQLGSVQHSDILIADRFVLDFLVDQVAGGMLRVSEIEAVARRLPAPDLAIHLDAGSSVLSSRLKPGDDLARVLTFADHYRIVAPRLGALTLTQPSAEDLRVVGAQIVEGAHG
jgi:thymidylate kinase